MAKHELTFRYEEATPGAFKYMENGPSSERVIGRLYVRKSAMGPTAPETLKITVEY